MQTKPETIVSLPTSKVLVSDLNTRHPTEAEVKSSGLVASVKESGQITPCLGRPHPKKKGCIELCAGARRRTACAVLGIPVQVIVRAIPDDEFEDIVLTENLQREDPDPIAEARLVTRRLAEGAAEKTIAARYGQSVLWVRRRAKLAQLAPDIAREWRKPGSRLAHFDVEMMEHIALFAPEKQVELTQSHNIQNSRNLTVLRAETERSSCKLDVPWLDNPATFVDGCGPGCANDSSKESTLFGFEDRKDCGRCLNKTCFLARQSLAMDHAIKQLLEKASIKEESVKAAFTTGSEYRHPAREKGVMSFSLVNQYDLHGYEIERLKGREKPKPDALVGLDVTNPDKPVLVVLKPEKGSQQAKAISAKKKKASDPAAAFADKAAAFQCRRWAKTRDKLLSALNEAENRTPKITDAEWVNLAGWIGTQCSNGSVNDNDTAWKDASKVREDLWRDGIQPVLKTRLRCIQRVEEFKDESVLLELREVSKLIGFDLAAAKKAVDLTELPVPKSWPAGIDPHTLEPATITAVSANLKGSGKTKPAKTATKKPATTIEDEE